MPLDYNEFAEKIKQKYPEYKDVDNYTLTTKMIEKYPEYKTQVVLKKKGDSQSTLNQSNTSSARLNNTTTKPTASLSLKGDGTYTFPGQEGVVFEKKNKQWSRKEKDSYEFKPIKEVERINNLEKRAVSLDKYSFEEAPAPKVEKTTFQAAPKAAPKKQATPTEKAAQKTFEQNFSALDVNSPEYLKRKSEQEKVNNSISNVDLNLVGMDEEDAVPKLKQSIKDYWYLEVDESGAGYDEVLVRNKVTGESKKISLDNWTQERDNEESKILRGFLDTQMNTKGYTEAYKRVNDLRSEIADATPTDRIALTEKLVDAQAKLTEEKNKRAAYVRGDKYLSAAIYDKNAQENIKTDLAVTQLRTEDYKEKVKDYEKFSTDVKDSYAQGKISKEDYYENYVPKLKAEKEMLFQEQQKLRNDYLQIKSDQQSIDEVAGDTFAIESNRGNVLTGTASAVLKGIESSVRFGLEGLSEEAGGVAEGSLQGVFQQLAPGSVSELYTNSENRSTFEKIVFGLSESGGAALAGIAAGGPAGSLMGLYASSYTNMKDQMNTPAFKDVPEWQKILMSSVYGATVGTLEELGISKWFTKSPAGKGLTNWILKKVISELPQDATAEAIDLAIKKSFKTAVANGLIQVTSAGLVEGSTELAQEGADMVYKDVFNKLNEKKFFENPNTWEGVFSRLGESFVLGFAGGAGMQSITQTTQTAKNAITMNQLNNIENLIENPNIKDIYKMNLKDQILSGEITSTQAKEQLQKLDELEATVNKIPNNVKAENKYQAFQLLNEREEIQKEIAGKDPALVAAQTERINAINEELKTISQNAVQKQTTSEVSVQPGAEAGGEVAQGESQAGSQVDTEEGQTTEEEKITVFRGIGNNVMSSDNSSTLWVAEDEDVAKNYAGTSEDGTLNIESLEVSKPSNPIEMPYKLATDVRGSDIANNLRGIAAELKKSGKLPKENISKALELISDFESKAGNNLELFTTKLNKPEANEAFSKAVQALGFDGVIQKEAASKEGQMTNTYGIFKNKYSNLLTPVVEPSGKTGQLTTAEDEQVATYRAEEQAELLKAIPKIESYKVNGEIDKTLMPKTVLAKYNKIYNKYDKLISPLLETIEQNKNLVSNQKETNLAENETEKPKAGNRLFNEPLKAVAEIANRYFQRVFGSQRPTFEGTTDLDVERAKRIAAAYEAMEDNPNDPEVRRAYEAMAKETIDQYQDFLDAGYVVEINNEEPYANSADMIEDLRKNKRIKIFSTEAGFGDDPITPEQRAENPLLAATEFTDINGEPMLVNDLFRAVHDFFGHAELGNSFGPKGEENAWNVHSRMYSPLARRAMTTETRGQNSYVNFSGVNERVEALREEARKLREEGKLDEAAEIVNKIYDEAKFADQKIGLLPQEFSEVDQDILEVDTKDATNLQKVLDALDKVDNELAKFGRETLGINIPVVTMRAIIKAAKVLVKTGITLQEAIIKAAEQLNVSKEDALNAVKFMSETIKAPVKKVLVNEAAALKDQLRLEARAAREAKTDLNTKRKQIATFIRSLETKGTITARQAAALVKRVSSLNLDNQTMVDRFEQYAEKVFKRAEYQDLLTSAFKVRRLIRKAIKSENQAEVVGMAKLFSKIDPSLVDDIDNYIALAESVLNAVRPSKQNVKDPALRQAANIETIAEYATTEIAKQEENRKREIMAEYKYLVDSGVLTEDLSVKEMQEIINLIDNPTAEFDPEADQKKLNFLQNRLASMEAVFRYMMANNINPFTGEDVVIDPKDADLIKRLLKMDLAEMSVRDAAKVVEAMDNFLMNNITSGLEAAVRSYEGAQNAKQLVAQGKKARPLKSYFNKTIGRLFGEQLISLPLLFEKMFPGIKNAANIMQKMGLVDVINGSNKAIRQHNDLMTEYSKQDFYKEKGFMEAKNVYERGMLAFLKRNLIGTKTEIRDEFKRRADIISQSIEALRENGTDKEKQMADLYQEVYDKLGVSELDIDVIEANADQMNKDATDWMINEWGKIYGELADVSLSVYNSMLGSDTNYTPDRYKKLSAEDQAIDDDILKSGSGFMMSMDYTDKNKTGVLMETTRPKALPKNEERRTTRYISLDFDVNNFNSLKGALVDINTAGAIRQVDGFARSRAFNKLVPEAKDRALLTRRINTYIQRVKGKRTASTDTIKDVERLANFVTGLGVGKALAGLDQPIKQTVPVMINTFINSNGNMTFVTPEMNEAINRSGMPISNRGLESQTAVESIDRLLDKTGGRGAEFIKKLEDLNQFWLKTLLAKPDVWVARSSFITYYLKDMRSKGINVKDIDWSTHEWNKDSAQYAQIMVDRQQNISDDKLAGDFLSSDDPTKRITRKVIMPFATFIMNQKARMHNDFLAWRSKDSSKEDKRSAVKSLIGLGAELAAYQLIAFGIKTLVYDSIANALVGDDEEEKKDKSLFGLKMTTKQFNATKFPVKSIVGDILSPLPFLDDIVVMGFDKAMELSPQISNEDIKKAVEEKNAILKLQGKDEMDDNAKAKFIEQLKADNIYSVAFKNDSQSGRSYGMIGIAGDTYKELIELSRMAYTGEFEDEYEGRVTNRYLPEEDRKILQNISVPLMILYSTGIAPKDLGTVARKVTNIVKKKGITENQHEKEKEVKKQIKRDLSSWEFELVQTRKKANGVVDEINYVESKGGLDDKQGKEYVKLIDAISSPSDDMLRDIQKGMTADQIIKKNTE